MLQHVSSCKRDTPGHASLTIVPSWGHSERTWPDVHVAASVPRHAVPRAHAHIAIIARRSYFVPESRSWHPCALHAAGTSLHVPACCCIYASGAKHAGTATCVSACEVLRGMHRDAMHAVSAARRASLIVHGGCGVERKHSSYTEQLAWRHIKGSRPNPCSLPLPIRCHTAHGCKA